MKVEIKAITPNCEKICEEAARTCYASENKITEGSHTSFLKNIIKSGHMSVMEHAFATFKVEGVSRSCLDQLVRHRLISMCLSGKTKISRYFRGGRKDLSIEEIYNRWHSKMKCNISCMNIRTLDLQSGLIVPSKIKNVFYSGIKEVFEVTTSLGYKIKASKDHIFFNSHREEIRLGKLNIGDKIAVNGENLYQNKEWFIRAYEKFNTTSIAKICNIAPCTARKWKRMHGISTLEKHHYKFTPKDCSNGGMTNLGKLCFKNRGPRPHNRGINHPIYQHNINLISFDGLYTRFRKLKKWYGITKCEMCDKFDQKLECHHIDKDVKNFSKENLMVLCVSCHKMIHRGYVVKKYINDTIISIKKMGFEKTYDIEVDNINHNFVADGFVVHNSVQSQRYVDQKDAEFVIPANAKIVNCELLEKNIEDHLKEAMFLYKNLINMGLKKEDARFILPQGISTSFTMTCNFRELLHIIDMRVSLGAQCEIRDLFTEIWKIMVQEAPNVFGLGYFEHWSKDFEYKKGVFKLIERG